MFCDPDGQGGRYSPKGKNPLGPDGIVWYTWKDSDYYSLRKVSMMIRPRTFQQHLSPWIRPNRWAWARTLTSQSQFSEPQRYKMDGFFHGETEENLCMDWMFSRRLWNHFLGLFQRLEKDCCRDSKTNPWKSTFTIQWV